MAEINGFRVWDGEFDKDNFTAEEIAESDLAANLVSEIIMARRAKGVSQRDLEELTGVKQSVIARMEKGYTSPQITTVLKLLLPLGKTLAVVPVDSVK